MTRIIPTIAYHLSLVCKPFADALDFKPSDSNIVYQSPKSQIDRLLVKPWKAMKVDREGASKLDKSYLIIIDALDEIDGTGGSDLLKELFAVFKAGQLAGLKLFATSRENPALVREVNALGEKEKKVFRLQDVGQEVDWKDVGIYLAAELPGFAEISKVSDLADGLFIYAATIVRYLQKGGARKGASTWQSFLRMRRPRDHRKALSCSTPCTMKWSKRHLKAQAGPCVNVDFKYSMRFYAPRSAFPKGRSRIFFPTLPTPTMISIVPVPRLW